MTVHQQGQDGGPGPLLSPDTATRDEAGKTMPALISTGPPQSLAGKKGASVI